MALREDSLLQQIQLGDKAFMSRLQALVKKDVSASAAMSSTPSAWSFSVARRLIDANIHLYTNETFDLRKQQVAQDLSIETGQPHYATLPDQAHRAIATAEQADRALSEEVQKAIATALAATGVTGGGIDLPGSVAGLHPPPPHRWGPCCHPKSLPQPSRRRSALRSGQIRQNHPHHPAAGWAWIAWVCSRCSAATCSA